MTGFFWLASYPKSGNTWLRLALSCLRHGKPVDFSVRSDFAPVAASRIVFDQVLGVESSDLTQDEIALLRPRCYEALAQVAPEPLFRKVHDAWGLTTAGEPLFPASVTLGTIYIVRDPRDVAVSFAHHLGVGIERVVDRMNDPRARLASQETQLPEQLPQFLGDWSAHVAGWLAAPGARPPLLVRYEDMRIDTAGELARIADYVGWPVAAEDTARAVADTRFETLSAAEDRHGFRERPNSARRFFRRGEAGGWRDALSASQVAALEAAHGAMMRRLGYLSEAAGP